MKNKKYYALIFLLIICAGISSCKKNTNDDGQDAGKSGVSMKINGVAWGSSINTLFTEELAHQQFGEYYHVVVGRQRLDTEDSESDVSAFNMYIIVPKAKFSNPKGTYQLMKENVMRVGDAGANFTDNTAQGTHWYASYDPASPSEAVGSVEITAFEIGKQSVAGQLTDIEGYTKLSGTFQMDLYPMDANWGPPLKITAGKFDLTSGIGFDFD